MGFERKAREENILKRLAFVFVFARGDHDCSPPLLADRRSQEREEEVWGS